MLWNSCRSTQHEHYSLLIWSKIKKCICIPNIKKFNIHIAKRYYSITKWIKPNMILELHKSSSNLGFMYWKGKYWIGYCKSIELHSRMSSKLSNWTIQMSNYSLLEKEFWKVAPMEFWDIQQILVEKDFWKILKVCPCGIWCTELV